MLIDSVPESQVGLDVMPSEVREFHKRVLRRRVDEVIAPAYRSWRASNPSMDKDVAAAENLTFDSPAPKKDTKKSLS